MNRLVLSDVSDYVSQHINEFHEDKLNALKGIDLHKLLRNKNPYLFKAKGLDLPQSLIASLLEAVISSSEEEIFGDFLEQLAIFIVKKTATGKKSTTKGIDLEFTNGQVHYIVSVKSGPNWGNNAQQTNQEADFNRAVKVAKQSHHSGFIQPVLGICYGKTKTNAHIRGAMKVVGQNFWYLLSENRDLYTDIIEPLGIEAKKRNEEFLRELERLVGKFTVEFNKEYANPDGLVDWGKLVKFNSQNLDIHITNAGVRLIPRKKVRSNRKVKR